METCARASGDRPRRRMNGGWVGYVSEEHDRRHSQSGRGRTAKSGSPGLQDTPHAACFMHVKDDAAGKAGDGAANKRSPTPGWPRVPPSPLVRSALRPVLFHAPNAWWPRLEPLLHYSNCRPPQAFIVFHLDQRIRLALARYRPTPKTCGRMEADRDLSESNS